MPARGGNRHAAETSHGSSARRSDAGYGRKKFSPRTDLDDRPTLGGKTPPSPGRRVPVDSPEDRRFSNRSKSHRRCRHAMETSQGRSDGRSDAGYGRKKFSPRTDLDDRPTLGGKTPPSPGRRVPVDSPEDRRFSNRSKSHRRCRHAMETSHGRSDGRSDAGYGSRVRLGTVGKAPHCGSRTPDFAVFLVRDFAKDYRRDANAGRRPPLAVSCRRRHRLWDAGDRVSISRRKKFSPRTDLDDRPRLGGKTPPSPGRRVPVDSPEDRRFSNRSKSHRRCRHAMDTSHGRSDGRSDAGYGSRVRLGTVGEAPHCGSRTPDFAVFLVRDSAKDYRRDANAGRRPPLAVSSNRRRRHRLWDAGDRVSISRRKKFSPRTDLDDRPMLGGKTPPSPGRRVPVDSPEDRRFSNRSKSHRRCRHAMETSQGRSDGRSDAGYGRKKFSPRTDLDDRPTLGGKTPPSPGRRVPVDSPEDRRFSNRSKSRRRCRHAMETSHGRSDGRSDADYGGRVRLGTAGDAPTGFRKNRVNGGSSYDSRTCVYVSSDFHIGQNRVADAGTRRKLRTDVPTDVPKPAMAAGSDSERWGKLLTVGVALRTLPFFWYGIPQKTTGATQTPAGDRRLRSRAGAGTGYGTQATASRYLEENFFLLEPTSTTGRRSAARPRPRPGDACRSIAPRTDVSQIGPNRIAVAGTPWKLRTDVPTDVPTPVMEEKNFLLEPTSTTGRRSAARPRPRPGDACRSIAPRTDVSQIGRNRIAVAGTPWKLRTDVPTDVPTPAMAAGSDSERWGKLLTVGVALRTLPFFWYGIPQKTTGATQTPAGDRRLRSRAGAGTGYGTQATASRYLEEKNFLLEPTSTTGRCSAARPRPRPGDACRSIAPRTDVSQIGPNRIAVAGTPWKLRKDVPTDVPTPVMEEKIFLLEPTSTTGRRSAARPRPSPGDACRSIAPRTDVSQIGPNRVAVAGTPWKLRTDVPTDVPTPTMAAGSDSVRRGMLLRDFAKIG